MQSGFDVSLGNWVWASMAGAALGSGLLLFAISVGRKRGYAKQLN